MTRAAAVRVRTVVAAIVCSLAAACGGEEPTGLSGSGDGDSGSGGDGSGGATQTGGANGTGAGSGTGAANGTGANGSGANGSGGDGPSGQIGDDVGDTMADLQWVGYVNESAVGLANQQPIVDYSVAALGETGAPYALMHFGAVF